MAYGVNSPMMNDEASYFSRPERDDVVWKQDDYNKVLQLDSVCWWDPKATAEHVPKSWTKIDIALYHGMHVGCDIESTNFQVVLQSQFRTEAGLDEWKGVHISQLSEYTPEEKEKLVRHHCVTIEIPEDILEEGAYSVQVRIWEHGGGWKSGWFWQGFGITPHGDV